MPSSNRIHLSKAESSEIEEELVLDALRSGWIAPLGPHVDAFEAEIAQLAGVEHALALSSGTAALHLALLHMGARPGRAVLVPTLTFAATANAVAYTGATPIFIDCQIGDGNVDPALLMSAVDMLQAEGTDIAAAMTVDLFGRCADYPLIEAALAERGVPLLEDAAEAVGASIAGRSAGSFGEAAVFSFNGNKILSTSGGGMLLSNDGTLIDRCRYLSTQARHPVPYYQHTEIGYNYRLSNILAALGRGQLRRLPEMIARRRAIRARYQSLFADVDGIRFLGGGSERNDQNDNCWLTTVELTQSNSSADAVVAAMLEQGIEARHVWKPMHMQPVFANSRSFLTGAAEQLFARAVNLPSGAGLTDSQIAIVAEALRRCF